MYGVLLYGIVYTGYNSEEKLKISWRERKKNSHPLFENCPRRPIDIILVDTRDVVALLCRVLYDRKKWVVFTSSISKNKPQTLCRERISENHLLGREVRPVYLDSLHPVRVLQRHANVCCFLPTRLIASNM